MRRALGLRDDARPGEGVTANRSGEQRQGGPVQRREPDRRTRRFVKDGEVPVVVLSGSREHGPDTPAPVNRLAAAENALDGERSARERAERSLHEALANVQHLQTQIAHANLAHREALAAEQRAREAAEHARAMAEQACAEATAAHEALATELDAIKTAPPLPPEVAPARRARRSEPKVEPEADEAQPVKWWLPSYKAKARKS